jgi:hypothetical protein
MLEYPAAGSLAGMIFGASARMRFAFLRARVLQVRGMYSSFAPTLRRWTVHSPTLGSIVEKFVKECEVVHSSNKKFI